MIMLARKWRPKTFEEVAGQESIVKTIKNAIQYNQVAQAYLFSGPRGSGKTTLARLLAMAMNCHTGPTIAPCNQCSSCKEISTSNSIDVIEIDGASNRGINEVRELREIAQYRPSRDKYKIIIIDEVHMLTMEAFNALLKILEEPPPHVIFIFATTELRKVPNTIISRCQEFEFKRLNEKSIKERLLLITRQEEIYLSASAISMLIKAAEGSLRDALSMLDQLVSFAGKNITPENIVSLLGFLNIEHRIELAEALLNCEISKAIQLLYDFFEKGYDARTIYLDLCTHFRNLLIILACPNKRQLLNLDENETFALVAQAEKTELLTVIRILNVLLDSDLRMRQSDQPSLYLEMLLAKVSQLKKLRALEETIKIVGQFNPAIERKDSAHQSVFFGDRNRESEKKSKANLVELDPFVKETPGESSLPSETKKAEEIKIESRSRKEEPNATIYKKIIEIKPFIASLLTSPDQLILKDDTLKILLPKNKELFKQELEKGQYGDVIGKVTQETFSKPIKIIVELTIEEPRETPAHFQHSVTPASIPSKNIPPDEKDPLVIKAAELFKGTIKKD